MSLSAAVIDALVASGATVEQLAAAMKADLSEQAERLTEKRRKDAERQQRSRSNRNKSRNVTVTPRDECDTSPNDIYILTPTEPGLSNDNPHPLPIRVVEAWNSGPAKSGATVSRTLNAKRKAALRVRVREHGEAAVFEAIRNLSGSKFHCGDNDRGWKANIGWLLTNPENFQKALEMEAPPDAVRSLSVAERAAAADRSADLFERMGRHDEAEERRALAATLRKAA